MPNYSTFNTVAATSRYFRKHFQRYGATFRSIPAGATVTFVVNTEEFNGRAAMDAIGTVRSPFAMKAWAKATRRTGVRNAIRRAVGKHSLAAPRYVDFISI